MMKSLSLIGVVLAAIACACSTSNSVHEHTANFSKVDSLTDAYLVLSDSLLLSWNRIVSTEMDKSRTLQEIINDLDNASLLSDELRESFQVRMEQLEKARFTQETVGDEQIVEDYDLAFQSLVNDLESLRKTMRNLSFSRSIQLEPACLTIALPIFSTRLFTRINQC
ncbi:MAG: hypothetical protein WDO15_17645 [Bacteroidota bacterium]